jgi:hypothetical protein
MTEKSVMLTNFPASLNVTDYYLMELCGNEAISNIHIQPAKVGTGSRSSGSRTAFAIIEFQNESSIQTVRRSLRKHWIQDKLLKIRTLKDT